MAEKVNKWVELLVEVEEMRVHQKAFFQKKAKVNMAKAKLCEIKVDQLVYGLKKICEEKGINLTQQEDAAIDD